MKLLIDENISWRIVKPLLEFYPDSIHVNKTNLEKPSKDTLIWEYAKKNNFIIVTNDEDFIDLLTLKGFPPKIIIFKTGNQSTDYLIQKLVAYKQAIIELEHQDVYGLIEIF
jgi:predicted nuclease of predicted toxin-antitoxin system